jgi:predicted MPP superfamily phosphohydrolase
MNIIQYIVSPAFEGLYNFNNSNYIYVASGVGTSGPPIRTMSKAKIGILNLVGNN